MTTDPAFRPMTERVFGDSCVSTSAARDEGGSGLGLAIVAELMHAHGGSVTIDESPPAAPVDRPGPGVQPRLRVRCAYWRGPRR